MDRTEYTLKAPILRVENVSLTLGGNLILRDVNVDVRDIVRPDRVTGQVVGLLGPSGVGKTRLFRIIAGLDEPNTGRVLIGNPGVKVVRGMVGVVAQSYPLFEHRTVLGNLQVAAKRANIGGDAARKKSMALLERLGLAERASYFPIQLSGGQRQRVAIAQQFVCSEHFLLMDEPFSGLDLIAIEKVCEFIYELASLHELNTVIVVTHDVTAAMAVADTILLLGRDRDATGNIVPGARIQASYNLMERGLAWRRGLTSDPGFLALLGEIRERFRTL